jgi:hypothetical protein
LKVNKTLETPDGSVQFEGELSSEELEVIISVGLNFLLQQGAIPFKVMKESEAASLASGNGTTQ